KEDGPIMMTPTRRLSYALAALALALSLYATSLYAQQPANISLQVGDYSMQLPIAGIQSQSLDNATLTTRYEDRRQVHISTVHRSEEHTSELQSRENLVCRLLLEKKNMAKRTR